MADDEVIEGDVEASSGSKKTPIIIGLAALLVGVGGGVAAMKFLGGDESPPPSADAEAGAVAPAASAVAESTEIVPMGSFTVNLRDSAGGRLLQMEISVEGDPTAAEIVSAREAQVRDTILMGASDYTYIELEGMDGKLRLRDDIHRRVNAVVHPERITRVYFTSFVVQ